MLNANNKVKITGVINSEFRFSHESYHEKFYLVDVSVDRLSGVADVLPVMVSEHLFEEGNNYVGTMVTVDGQYRSHTYRGDDGKNHLQLYVFADNIELAESNEMTNSISLKARICKPPVFRTTPRGYEITEFLVAVNRPYGKTDRIPCIAWGVIARKAHMMNVDSEVCITGRIQSRKYSKRVSETECEWRTAYEVSIGNIEENELFSNIEKINV